MSERLHLKYNTVNQLYLKKQIWHSLSPHSQHVRPAPEPHRRGQCLQGWSCVPSPPLLQGCLQPLCWQQVTSWSRQEEAFGGTSSCHPHSPEPRAAHTAHPSIFLLSSGKQRCSHKLPFLRTFSAGNLDVKTESFAGFCGAGAGQGRAEDRVSTWPCG